MSNKNENEPIEVDEVVDVPVENVGNSHEWEDEVGSADLTKVNLEAEAKKVKAKKVKHRVLFTSPLGRAGDIVTVDPNDHRVKHLLSIGGLEKV